MTNQVVEQVYGGDLYGNVWRFDLSSPSSSNWATGVTKIAQLTAPDGTPQPVTTAPEIEMDIISGLHRWVFVGTGRLLHNNDLKDTQRETFYAIKDGNNSTIDKFPKPLTRADLGAVTSAAGLATEPPYGWYNDLGANERMVVPPVADLSTVVFAGTLPQNDPCLTGQPANVYAREYSTGKSAIVDSSGTPQSNFYSSGGATALSLLAGPTTGEGIPTVYVAVSQADPSKKTAIVQITPPPGIITHRMSWRLLGE